MKNYDFAQKFHALYDQAAGLYARGQRGAETFFTAEDKAWLAANGLAPQHLYDYAEDQGNYGEPGYDHALGIELVRRDYFLDRQKGAPSRAVLDESKLPGKAEAVRGIEWLPPPAAEGPGQAPRRAAGQPDVLLRGRSEVFQGQ